MPSSDVDVLFVDLPWIFAKEYFQRRTLVEKLFPREKIPNMRYIAVKEFLEERGRTVPKEEDFVCAGNYGMLILASILEKEGFSVEWLDLASEWGCGYAIPTSEKDLAENCEKIVGRFEEEAVSQILEVGAEVIGVGPTTANYPLTRRLMEKVKELDPNTKVVIGGVHASFLDLEVLKGRKGRPSPFDVVVKGEAETIIVDLVRNLIAGKMEALKDIPGITYREEGRIIRSETWTPIPLDLNELPMPAYHLLEKIPPLMLITTARGCPYRCVFCHNAHWPGRIVRYRNISLVLDEMEYLMEKGAIAFYICDETFTLNRKHVLNFCREMKTRRVDVPLRAGTRVDFVSHEILKKLVDVGLVFMNFGPESGVDSILERLNKRFTTGQVLKALELCKEPDIDLLVVTNWIFGNPGDTVETMMQTLGFMRLLYEKGLCDVYNCNVMVPFPGSDLYHNPEKYGVTILTRDWSLYHPRDFPVFKMDTASPEEIYACFLLAQSFRRTVKEEVYREWRGRKNRLKCSD